MLFLADWTTVRWGSLTAVTWFYAVATVIIFTLCVVECVRAAGLWRIARDGREVPPLDAQQLRDAAALSLYRALGRLVIQILLGAIVGASAWVQMHPTYHVGYWFRTIFTIAFFGVQIMLGLLVVNEQVGRRRILGTLK